MANSSYWVSDTVHINFSGKQIGAESWCSHRTLSIRSYIYSFAFVWILAAIMFIFLLHFSFFWQKCDSSFQILFHNCGISDFFFSLAITCASYVLIRQQTRQNFSGIRAQKNKKLTNTLLIETVVSAFCWLPMIICSAVFEWSSIEDVASDHSYYTLLIVKTLQYFNSMVNLIP